MADAYETELCKLFGKNLRRLRKHKGWSQEKLALETGFARSYIGDVERGVRNVSLVNIVKLADHLEVPVIELMDFRDPGDEVSET